MSAKSGAELPTVVLPYVPLQTGSKAKDIFVYLRPETNGVRVESAILQVVSENQLYDSHIELVYLANIPGEFMTERRLIEDQYCYKLPFAHHGKQHFTQSMRIRFEEYFRTSFDSADVLGAFEALERLSMSDDDLFHVWVEPSELLYLNGQSIKRVNELYVVNYDIPALLAKYTSGTDIAVMMFRSTLSSDEFAGMIDTIELRLREEGILGEKTPRNRAFHVSDGPFEQILDARGHLFVHGDERIDFQDIQYCKYLIDRGIDCRVIEKALHFPIMQFRTADGSIIEDCLYDYTRGESYQTAFHKFRSAIAQFVI